MFEVPSISSSRLLQKIVDKLSLFVHWILTHLGLTVVNELNESKEPRP